MVFFLLIGVLLGVFSVIFALQNVAPVTVMFLTWQIQGSLATILFVAISSGLLVALFLLLPSFIRDQYLLSKERRKNAELERELGEHKRIIATSTKAISEQEGGI